MAANSPVAERRRGCPSTRMSLLRDLRESANAEAWREFVDGYTGLVYGYCRQRGLQEADARDVTQNVFLAVSRAMRSFAYDPARGRFRSWLGTITCREIRAYMTRAGRLGRLPGGPNRARLTEVEGGLEAEWTVEFNAYMFSRAIDRIRPTFAREVWRAFELTWLEDDAPSDVAERLGRPTAWVYKAKFRVLRRLSEEVEALVEDFPIRPR